MDDIKDIVDRIVGGCAQGGVTVTDILAAFVARTVRTIFLELIVLI
jgi:hypothetical protein